MSSLQLPNEVWIHVFDDNPELLPSDLNAILRTSRTFYGIAYRILHKRIVWNDPFHLFHNLEFWKVARVEDKHCLEIPRSITIGVSRMSGDSKRPRIVNENGIAVPSTIPPVNQRTFAQNSDYSAYLVLRHPETAYGFEIENFACPPLHQSMLDLASAFTNLNELAFIEVILPQSFHEFVHQLPKLRKLHLEVCVLPPTETSEPDHTDLPITELILQSLYYAIDMSHMHSHTAARGRPMDFLNLASATTLHTLHFDATAPVVSIFGRQSSPPVPPNLRHMFIHPLRLTKYDVKRNQSGRPGGEQARRAEDHSTLMLSIARFLVLCDNIESISTCYAFSETGFTTQMIAPVYFASHNLRNYSGPAISFKFPSFDTAQNLQAIDITEDLVVLLLQNIVKFGEFHNLRVFSVRLHANWDNEIAYAVCNLLPQLVRLKIVYNGYGPDDNYLVGLGPNFLSRLNQLHTFQLYEASGKPPVITGEEDMTNELASEPELKALIAPWKFYCSGLREVQLVDGYLWRRADATDAWRRRDLPAETVDGYWRGSLL